MNTETKSPMTNSSVGSNMLPLQCDLIFPEASTETAELLQRLHLNLNFSAVNQTSPFVDNNTNALVLETNPITPSIHDLIPAADEMTIKETLRYITDPNVPNRQGLAPLTIAVVYKRADVIPLLLAHPNINPNVTDRSGLAPLHYVCSFGSDSSLPRQHKVEENEIVHLRMLELLLQHPKIDINIADSNGNTPLLLAVMSGNVNCVAMLLNKGASVNVCSMLGTTPLHVAAERGHVNFVHLLLGAGAHVNAQDNFGQTPLHLAAKNNQKEIVKILKQHGANVNIADIDGRFPFSLTASEDIRNILLGMKTSETHPLQVDFVVHNLLGNSKIGMTMCPGRNKGEWRRDLAADLTVLKSLHVDVLVSLVKDTELQSMGIAHLTTSVESYGMESIHFPIQDKWIPSNIGEVASLVEIIVLRVHQGKTIVVHCNGGKGRTGLVVVATLYALGIPIDDGIKLIRDVRPGMIQNPVQLMYLKVFKMYWDNKHKRDESVLSF
jgi:ankyrin repeat protein/protein-tyrosine phosphatase